jgi:hypothetical protein
LGSCWCNPGVFVLARSRSKTRAATVPGPTPTAVNCRRRTHHLQGILYSRGSADGVDNPGEKWQLLVRSRGRRLCSGSLRSSSDNPVYWQEGGGGPHPGFRVWRFDLHGWSTSDMNAQVSTCDELLAPYRLAANDPNVLTLTRSLSLSRPELMKRGVVECVCCLRRISRVGALDWSRSGRGGCGDRRWRAVVLREVAVPVRCSVSPGSGDDRTCGGDRRGRPDRDDVGGRAPFGEREVSGWAATCWVFRRSTRRRSR